MQDSLKQRYLGDGLYADCDGYQIRLYADRETGRHEVFLDRYVLEALIHYAKDLGLTA